MVRVLLVTVLTLRFKVLYVFLFLSLHHDPMPDTQVTNGLSRSQLSRYPGSSPTLPLGRGLALHERNEIVY